MAHDGSNAPRQVPEKLSAFVRRGAVMGRTDELADRIERLEDERDECALIHGFDEEVDRRLHAALQAADYLIGVQRMVIKQQPVRNYDEALSAYEHAKAAIP